MSKFTGSGRANSEKSIFESDYMDNIMAVPEAGVPDPVSELNEMEKLFDAAPLLKETEDYYRLISPKSQRFQDVSDGDIVTSEIPDNIDLKKPIKVNNPNGAQALVDNILAKNNPVQEMDADDRVNVAASVAGAEEARANAPLKFNERTGQMEPNFYAINTAEQDKFGTAANARFEEGFTGQQPISDFTTAIRSGETATQEFFKNEVPAITGLFQAKNQLPLQVTRDFSKVMYDAGEKLAMDYNAKYADKSRLNDPKTMDAVQRIIEQTGADNYNSITALNYQVFAPAKQNLEANMPGGLSSAFIMSTLYSNYNAERARSRAPDNLDRDVIADTPEKYKALTAEQKAGVDALESQAWFASKNSKKGVGYLINQAGGLAMTAQQIATTGAIAEQQVRETFPEWFVPMNTQEENNYISPNVLRDLGESQTRLNRGMMRFVGDNLQTIKFLLGEPLKALRDKPKKWSQVTNVLQKKAKQDNIKNIFSGKQYTAKEYEDYARLSVMALENTPFTIRPTTLGAENLIHGFNPDSGREVPNSVTNLIDGPGKGFKHIKKLTLDNGQPSKLGSREKYFMKYDEDGEHKVTDFADENADNLRTLNLFHANSLLPSRNGGALKQFYKDFFHARGSRAYEDQDALNSDDPWSRALTGQGTNVTFKIDGKSAESRTHIMLLKAGIVRNMGIKLPDADLKYDKVTYEEGANGFDAIIGELQSKYGKVVELADAYVSPDTSFEKKLELQQALMNKDDPISLMFAGFISYSQPLDGIYTRDAIIEAIKLKNAIDAGKPIHRTNFVSSLDGINNGLAIAALQSGFSRLLEGTGLSIYLIGDSAEIARNKGIREKSPAEAFLHPEGLVAGDGPAYYQAAAEMAHAFNESTNSQIRALGALLYNSGLLGNSAVKDAVMVCAFGAGEGKVLRLSTEALQDAIDTKPEFARALEGIMMTPEDIAHHMGKANWSGITSAIGPLQEMGKNKSDFIRNLHEQKENNPNLPNFKFIAPNGEIMTFGAIVPTASGPQYHFEGIDSFQEVTNTYNSLLPDWNKETAKMSAFSKASTQVAPSTIHPYDATVKDNSLFRQLVDNPGKEHGQMGNVFLPKHDGFYASPMYLPYLENILNEEHYKIGYHSTVSDGLIAANEALGYDMDYVGTSNVQDMPTIRARLKASEAQGKHVMKYIRTLNQFAGGNLTKTKVTGLNKEVVTKLERKNHNAKSAMEALGLTKANRKNIKSIADKELVEMPVFNNVKIKAPPFKPNPKPFNSKRDRYKWENDANKIIKDLKENNLNFDTEVNLKILNHTLKSRELQNDLSFMNTSPETIDYQKLRGQLKFKENEQAYNDHFGLVVILEAYPTPNSQLDLKRTSEISYSVQTLDGRARILELNQDLLDHPRGRTQPAKYMNRQ